MMYRDRADHWECWGRRRAWGCDGHVPPQWCSRRNDGEGDHGGPFGWGDVSPVETELVITLTLP